MKRWQRILRHRWLDERDAWRALGGPALQRLEDRIAAAEQRHSGEIRLCIEAGLPLSYLWRGATPRERALAMFAKLNVWDTAHNNGVLIYVLLAEHAIELVVDRGLAEQVDGATWADLVAQMREDFRGGAYEAGLVRAIDTVDALLLQHFPLAAGQPNPDELPNRPHLG